MSEEEKPGRPCPACGSPTESEGACHTYPGRSGGFMSCFGCYSATRHRCMSETCEWEYTDGLNKGNPRSLDNETRRPDWIAGTALHF